MGCTGMAWHTLSPAQQADYGKKNPFRFQPEPVTPLTRPRDFASARPAAALCASTARLRPPAAPSPTPRRRSAPHPRQHCYILQAPHRLFASGPRPSAPAGRSSHSCRVQRRSHWLSPSRPRPVRRRPILVKSQPRFLDL
ncbi:hypothetical protein PVAP13_5KG347207 [Panicum virgatum]|uniref:Uncharacterized protein n=1 Tax=Panicum virgatum TaxID=38727 RepID=A0A8T0SGE0_PANVG|nr:hypothetical protein PVAP13_5KG347207 [Panicum virgatum]